VKLAPWLWGALVVLAVLVLYGHWRDTREAEADRVHQQELDALNLRIHMQDAEGVKLQSENARWQAIADSLAKLPHSVPAPRAPLPSPAIATGTPSDSAAQWRADAMQARARADSLASDNAALRQTVSTLQDQMVATGHLLALSRQSDSLHTAQRDSALAIANRAPVTHKRGFAVFGLRLCPVIGPSYSVIPGVGQGFGGSVTQPLSCGA
jgi:hypothetical protein